MVLEERIPPYAISQGGSHAGCPQDKNMTTYFKLILPHTENALKVAIWVSRTPKQFLLPARTTIHACKQMGLDVNFTKAKMALEFMNLDIDIVKSEYSSEKMKTKEHKQKSEN